MIALPRLGLRLGAAWALALIFCPPARAAADQPAGAAPASPVAAAECRVLAAPDRYLVDLTQARRITNRRIVLENCGSANVVNPWVIVNRRRDWFDTPAMLAEALGREADPAKRAFRLWRFIADHRYHWVPAEDGMEVHDPVKLMNVYGYGLCDDSASSAEALFTRAGFARARTAWITGHVIPEVWYGGAWHMLDPDLDVFYPDKKNRAAASVRECQAQGWLVGRVSGDHIEQIYTARNNRITVGQWETRHTMAMVLRPGESLERDWDNWGKFHDTYTRQAPPRFGNGRLTWAPDLGGEAFRGGLESHDNLEAEAAPAAGAPRLHPLSAAEPGEFEFKMECPYVFVGGQLEADCLARGAGDRLTFDFSRDGENWVTLGVVHGPFQGRRTLALDAMIAPLVREACYEFSIRVRMEGRGAETVGLNALKTTGEIQCAPAALPALEPGKLNTVEVRLATAEGGALRVRQEFDYQPRQGAALNLVEAVYPGPGERVRPSQPTFCWRSADAEAAGYEIMVAWDAEGTMPVSPALRQRVGRQNFWTAPAGWLKPGKRYYWRVRAVDDDGEWTPWSEGQRFEIEKPAAGLARLWKK